MYIEPTTVPHSSISGGFIYLFEELQKPVLLHRGKNWVKDVVQWCMMRNYEMCHPTSLVLSACINVGAL